MHVSKNGQTSLTLVLIHGFLDCGATWRALERELAGLDIRFVSPDLRGAGSLSNSAGPYSLEQATEDVLKATGSMRNLVFIGHSMGAQIAELAAAQAAERTHALVLITPTPLEGNALPEDARNLLRNAGADLGAQQKIRQMFSLNMPAQMLSPRPDDIMGVDAVQGYYDAFTTGTAAGRRPALFDGRTLLIGAMQDPVIPPDMVKSIHLSRFEGAELFFVEGSGHWPQVEQPAIVASRLRAFLELPARGN